MTIKKDNIKQSNEIMRKTYGIRTNLNNPHYDQILNMDVKFF